jgi:tetratricopeptide (TPR) repeat protein
VGVNLWRVYLLEQRQQENEGAEAEARKVKLQEKREKVERVLTAGVTRLKEKEVDTSLARAVLSLAQLYVDTNRAEQALQWLNDPKVGSLTLIKAGNRHAQAPEFQSEAYKVALRSYISLLPKQKDQAAREATMKSAEAMMNLLEKEGAKDQQAADRLTQIYIVMGRELESQLKEVGRDRKAREALSEAFEQFLGRIASRPGNNYNTLIWVAQTFFNLGSAADAGQREVTPAVKNYFGKAAGTYRQILAADAASPGFVPSDRVKAGIVMNLVRSLRRMGDLDGAMALLRPMLTQQPNNVAAQIEAAQTLQDRGEEASFEKAVFGDFPDPKTKENIVWGWTRLAGRAATNPKLADIYLEAALRSYECRYLLGLKIGSPRKEKLLRAAKTGIEALYGKHPALGNPKTKHQLDNVVRHLTPEQRSRLPELKRQFDILARDIQKGLNEPPTGLKAFDPPTSETPTTAPPAN